MTIDIVGAGIGGLTTAIALQQKGFKTRIFEQAGALQPVGAGIILANNAMQVYDKIGVRAAIEKNGNPISAMNITDVALKPISKIDLRYFERKHGVKNIAIHRGALQRILVDKLNSVDIHLNHCLEKIIKTQKGYSLRFTNGHQHESRLLLGADGLHSVVRQELFPSDSVRRAKQLCWRGIVDYQLPKEFTTELNEAWGGSSRFGMVQIAKNKVYWYALKSFKKTKDDLSLDEIKNYFGAYHMIVKDLIAAAPQKAIHTAEILDLKPIGSWYIENVCLIGDAAHATTPNMGQGACQAIEDAFVLSECLSNYASIKAFEEFQKLRMPKAHHVVKASWNIGKMAHISNPLIAKLRNGLMRFTPTSMNRKQSEKIFELASV